MTYVRLYVNKGCQNCERTMEFLKEKKISFEAIEIGFDPILLSGIRASSTNGAGLPYPVIVSFITQDVRVGYDESQLQQIVDAVRSSISSNFVS